MLGQNTQKQILAMTVMMLLGVISFGVYIWFDDGRRAEAEDRLLTAQVEQGAKIFASNCRVCHGNQGEGGLGLTLNKPDNTLAFRTSNSGALAGLENRFRFTIACGRNGTVMPPWSIAQGGSLNDFKIEALVTLITTNAGNIWEEVAEIAREKDEATISTLRQGLRDAEAGGTAEQIDIATERLEDAEDRLQRGLPVAAPTPTTTANTCGQRSAAAASGPAPAAPAVDTSGFSANLDRG